MSWNEFNITPGITSKDQFLAEVIDPFLSEHKVGSWHFFWEPGEGWEPGEESDPGKVVMRFRILTGDVTAEILVATLDKLMEVGLVADHYQGAHGKRGEVYEGEEQLYGTGAWPVTFRYWEAISDLALQLACLAHRGELELPRSHHWKRMAHLAANQMCLPDVRMNLEQGHRYLQVKQTHLATGPGKAEREIMTALDKYLYQEDVI